MFKSLSRNMKIRNAGDIEIVPPSNKFQSILASRAYLESFVANMNSRFTREGTQVLLTGCHICILYKTASECSIFRKFKIRIYNPINSPPLQSLKLIVMQSSSGTMLKAIVSQVLKANIIMQGIVVDRVIIHSFNEETTNETIWPPSKFIVFNKLTEIANSASLYFGNATKFFIWLSYYQNLYSQPCRGCGKILCDENNKDRFLPPIRRDFNQLDKAYHLSCFQNSDDLIL